MCDILLHRKRAQMCARSYQHMHMEVKEKQEPAVTSCSRSSERGDEENSKDATVDNIAQLRHELTKARLDVEVHMTTITTLQSTLRAMERT